MEEKIAKLMLKAKEISEKSKKYYVDVEYEGNFDKLTVSIRIKESHTILKEIQQYDYSKDLNDLDMVFLKALEEYEKELVDSQ